MSYSADEIVGPGPALRIDNHFPVMLGSRRPTRPTHNDPCSPGRPYLRPGLLLRAAPPDYPLTDPLQFDILQSDPGWRGPNAIRSIEAARLHHAARRCGGGVAAPDARAAGGEGADHWLPRLGHAHNGRGMGRR